MPASPAAASPWSIRTVFPVATSHTRMTLSSPVETICRPSGAKAMSLINAICPPVLSIGMGASSAACARAAPDAASIIPKSRVAMKRIGWSPQRRNYSSGTIPSLRRASIVRSQHNKPHARASTYPPARIKSVGDSGRRGAPKLTTLNAGLLAPTGFFAHGVPTVARNRVEPPLGSVDSHRVSGTCAANESANLRPAALAMSDNARRMGPSCSAQTWG